MNYLSVKQAAEKWKMTPRRVQVLCNENRIDGAKRVGNIWVIPETSEKPIDARKRNQSKKAKKINENVRIERVWSMPNKNTFDIKPIQSLIKEEMTDGLWIDPFANSNKFATITNDLNEKFDTDYHLDALDFMKMFEDNSIDGVLYDPPYSPRQVSECYNNVGLNVTWDTTKSSFWGNHKREISRVVKIGGKVITFGWNSGGIGYKYGFEIERILLVPHGGWHNDTICTVEIKTHDGIKKDIQKDNKKTINRNIVFNRNKFDEKLITLLKQLPDDYWDFKNNDTREYTHGIHSYPAMMVCPISRNIIDIVKKIKKVNSIFDPFTGSGTVLVEGILANIDTIYGNDINPLALFISKVKTKRLDINKLQRISNKLISEIQLHYENNYNFFENVDKYCQEVFHLDLTEKESWGKNASIYLEKYINHCKQNFDIPNFKNMGYWFKPRVILQLQLIKNYILAIDNKDIRDFIFVAFSESIRLVSNRRNGEFKMFRMPSLKVKNFEPNVIEEFMSLLERNIEKMNDFVEICSDTDSNSNVVIFENDATELNDVPDLSVDLVITSPPYGDSKTTVAYGEYSRLSLQWLDLQELSDKQIMSIDKTLMGGTKFRNGFEYSIPSDTLKQSLEIIKDNDLVRAGDVYSFYSDLEKSISAISKKTCRGGYQFWVVGNRKVKGELLKTDVIISEIANYYDLDYVYTVNRNIINKVMPSLNSPTNAIGKKSETICNEHIVILRKR